MNWDVTVENAVLLGNITPSPEYRVYISQLIRYSIWSLCLDRAQLLTQKLLKHGNVAPRLKSSIQKLYGRHHDLVDCYEISISIMTIDLLLFMEMFSFLYHCQDFYRTWLYIWVARRVSYKKKELLTLREHLDSPLFVPISMDFGFLSIKTISWSLHHWASFCISLFNFMVILDTKFEE